MTAHPKKIREFVGKGFFIQALGLATPLLLAAQFGELGLAAGLLVGLALLIVGGRLAIRWACSRCANDLPSPKALHCTSCDTALA